MKECDMKKVVYVTGCLGFISGQHQHKVKMNIQFSCLDINYSIPH